jgi:hypothetical protein
MPCRCNIFHFGDGERWQNKKIGTTHVVNPDVKHVFKFGETTNRGLKVFFLASSDIKADPSRICSHLPHTFLIALSLTLYSRVIALLLGAFVLLSFAMILHRWDSLKCFPFGFFNIAAESND